jgi:hypothetical protein
MTMYMLGGDETVYVFIGMTLNMLVTVTLYMLGSDDTVYAW